MKSPKLVIPIDEIPSAGLPIDGELPVEWIAESLLPPYEPIQPLEIELTLKCINDNVLVQGTLKTSLAFRCSRSLETGVLPIAISFSELFQPSGKHHTNLGDGVESDAIGDEPFVYEGGRIELEAILREEFVLAQPPYPTLGDESQDQKKPVWSSSDQEVDPRWQELKNLKLN